MHGAQEPDVPPESEPTAFPATPVPVKSTEHEQGGVHRVVAHRRHLLHSVTRQVDAVGADSSNLRPARRRLGHGLSSLL
jgi:hypothetical protein